MMPDQIWLTDWLNRTLQHRCVTKNFQGQVSNLQKRSLHGKERKVGLEMNSQKISRAAPSQSKENALFDINKALRKRHFRSFAE